MNPILQTFLETFATAVATGLLGVITTFGLKFLNLQNSTQANNFVQAATKNAAGAIALEVHKGLTSLSDVHITSPRVQAAVQYVQDRVAESVQASGVSPETLALMIVGKVKDQLGQVATPGVDVPSLVAQVRASLVPPPAPVVINNPLPMPNLSGLKVGAPPPQMPVDSTYGVSVGVVGDGEQTVKSLAEKLAMLPHNVQHSPVPAANLVPEHFNAQSSPPVPGVPVTTAAEDAQHGEKHA